ncbi:MULTISPECIES: hypothetical protein [Chryseobacterium]|uniref:Uncharacterized protein n=1 Tax=Candidatus Chryseobacterium massiliense TaxID=204089 RepID=A0A3D9B2Y2_9FLAO|nr:MULTISPECIES: hypothetical protein [Chryseobacterium]REC47879.1 hypothetical protein DRF68_12620 [Candidatus Chryseobacterium massiliae]
MSKEIDVFTTLLARKNKLQQALVLQWAKVTSVDWENKTCDAKGIDDDLEFFDVLIGVGSFDVKPKVGSLIIIGIINNDETTPVLLSAEEVDKIEIKAGNCELTIDQGFLFKKENETLKKLMVDLLQEIQKMKFTTNTGSTINLVNQPQFQLLENRFKSFLK